MAGIGGGLHNGGSIFFIVELSGGCVLLEMVVALPSSFSYVGNLVSAGLVFGTGARRVVDNSGFALSLSLDLTRFSRSVPWARTWAEILAWCMI